MDIFTDIVWVWDCHYLQSPDITASSLASLQSTLYTAPFPLLPIITPRRLPVAFITQSQHCSLRTFMVQVLIISPSTTYPSLSLPTSLYTLDMLNWIFVLCLHRLFLCLTHAFSLCLERSLCQSLTSLPGHHYSSFSSQLSCYFLWLSGLD